MPVFPFCIQHPVDIFQPVLKQLKKVRQSWTNGTELALPHGLLPPNCPSLWSPFLELPKALCMQAPTRQQTDLNAAIFRVTLLLFCLLISAVCLSSFYSPNRSPDIADTAVPCYLHGEALCWFPCRYFSLTHPAKLGEPGGRLIAWRRYCRHITCLQLRGHKGSTSLLGYDGESRLVLLPRATARYPPQVGSQRVLHALPGRRNGFSLHRLNLPDYAPSPSVISPPPGRHQAEFLPGRAAEGRQPPAGHAGGTFQNSSPRTACCSSSSVRLGDYSSCFHNAIQTSLKSLRKECYLLHEPVATLCIFPWSQLTSFWYMMVHFHLQYILP